jgi:S1-C subfamily serine protease
VTTSVVALDVLKRATDPIGGSTFEQSSATGFVLAPGGFIATNAHVVKGAQRVTVTFSDGRTQGAALLGSDAQEDLAVVKVARTGLTPLDLAADHEVRVGEFVFATGNALALEGTPTVTVGIISALNRSITLNDGTELSHLLQTDAAISAGDSGGPLLTASGEVIGINSASASGGSVQNIGFAIPVSRARAVLLRLAGLS